MVVDNATRSVLSCGLVNRGVVRWSRDGHDSGQKLLSNIDCRGLALDNEGCLYTSDYMKDEVRRWGEVDGQGTVVAGANGRGHRLDQFNYPTHIFVDQNQSIYVSDTKNHRVMKCPHAIE